MSTIFINFIYFCTGVSATEISIGKYTHFDEIMNILDIIILLCCIPILISGYKKGFINQAFSIMALMAGAWIASGFGSTVGEWIFPLMEGKCENPEQLAYIGGYAITFISICIIFFIIGKLVEKLLLIILPEWINKSLGLVVSVINAILLMCVLYMVFEALNKIYFFTDTKGSLFTDSLLFPIIENTAKALLPNMVNFFI